MDVAAFAAGSKLRIIIGKGGVGKTVVCSALAITAARAGLRTLIVELEGRPEVGRAFGSELPLSYEPQRLLEDPSGGSVDALCLRPDDALAEYLGDHGLGRIATRLGASGLIDIIAGTIPGIRDVLVLGKVKQLVNEADADLILLDAPATGHAVTQLTSAAGMVDAARSGPVRRQAEAVVEMLSDPAKCQVTIVTLAEELPVTEAVEAAFLIEDRAGVALGPVVVNRVVDAEAALAEPAAIAARAAGLELEAAQLDALDEAASFTRHRAERASLALERLSAELPLELLVLPELSDEELGPEQLRCLADRLSEQIAELAR